MDARYLIITGLFTFFITQWVVSRQRQLGIIDDPKLIRAKNTHEYPVPRGGGLAIGMGVLLSLLLNFYFFHNFFLLLAICLATLVGFIDDRDQDRLSPYFRLFVNLFVSAFIWVGGLGIHYITGLHGNMLFLEQGLSLIFTCLWLTWMQNVVGWSSGVDGQLPGFVIIAALMVGVFGGNRLSPLSFIVAGAYLGFLPWNWYPQKIMPGYGGKSLAGLLLGIIAIQADVKIGTMLIVLAIPFIDALLAIIKRLREGRSPVWGGRDHLHHYLLDSGWSKPNIALFYWLTTFLGGLIALRLKAGPAYFTMATVVLVTLGALLWLRNWSLSSKPPGLGNG